MTEFDQGYELLFSHPEMVRDLLIGFKDESVVARFASFGGPIIIWRVRFADRWLYVYLVLEFQSSVDPYMVVRVMAYIGLLYQDLIRTKQIPDNGKLPPVLPIVQYERNQPGASLELFSDSSSG